MNGVAMLKFPQEGNESSLTMIKSAFGSIENQALKKPRPKYGTCYHKPACVTGPHKMVAYPILWTE